MIFFCDSFHKTKQQRLPFNKKSKTIAENIFDPIHVDTWDKFLKPTYNNKNYLLTIVDD